MEEGKETPVLAGGVRRLELQGGVRYILPRRPLLGGMLLIPLVLSVVFMGAGSLVSLKIPIPESDRWLLWVFGYGFGSVGVALLPLGIFLPFGHVEIEHTRSRFRVTSRAGFLSWSRSLPSAGLSLVSAIHTPAETEHGPVKAGPGADSAMLRATWEGGRTMTVAATYPLSWLTGVARDLSARLGPGAGMEVVRDGKLATTSAAPSQQPAGSNAVLRPFPGGFSLLLPPRGLRRGSDGLLSFGLLWLGMCVFLDGVTWFLMRKQPILWYCITGFMGFFSSIGFIMVGAALHKARRKATLEVGEGRLKLSSEGLFGKKRRDWALGEIDRIQCGPSGHATNGIPHMALCIEARGQEPAREFSERDPVELRWIAGLLSAEVARSRVK